MGNNNSISKYTPHNQQSSHKTTANNSHLTIYPSHNIAVLQAPIRTSILCNNYHNKEPERSDPTPAKHTQNRSQASYRKSRPITKAHEQDLIAKGTKFYLYDTTHNRAATSRSSTSRSQPPKVIWNDRASQEESNSTSNASNNGRQRRELTGKAHGITDSACKNQSVMVSIQYGPLNTYIQIRSTTIDESRVARDPITMHTSWRSNSDIARVTSIGYPRIKASGESSTTKHRLLHASGPHPIPPPNDPNKVGKRVKVRHLSCRVSMTFRVVRTNQYNQDLGLINSTNGNHLESPNEGSSIDHQVTIHLNAQNIIMFPTNETWYFVSQMLVSSSGGLILILTAQSTRNEFRIHSDY
ncbi:hypothetical protein F511_09990 [Dorcoceras hygrometricum]|uniref:Uncharacterized protein n=1 Tax=Dorcoceras hygrometricum TaxID=472368 RepID=A0A2Z7AFU0_9LAMI|nr:hypothetical protein F511_09990 [Dorcoceras hygrometricum]